MMWPEPRAIMPGSTARLHRNGPRTLTAWRLDQPDLRHEVEARIPVGRVATPEEIADAVALLASGRLAYMTGSPLIVDGGMSAI